LIRSTRAVLLRVPAWRGRPSIRCQRCVADVRDDVGPAGARDVGEGGGIEGRGEARRRVGVGGRLGDEGISVQFPKIDRRRGDEGVEQTEDMGPRQTHARPWMGEEARQRRALQVEEDDRGEACCWGIGGGEGAA
jgi:hypothetical protein